MLLSTSDIQPNLECKYRRKSITAGMERPSEAVFLNHSNLEGYIQAEYKTYLMYLGHEIDNVSDFHGTSPFIQEQYDGVTLPNNKKYLSQSTQFMAVHKVEGDKGEDKEVLLNWNLATGCAPCSDSSANGTLEVLEQTFDTIPSKVKVKELIRSGISDAAALSDMRKQSLEPEGCLMHGGQKIAESGVGRLTQSKNNTVVDPFPEGLRLTIVSLSAHYWLTVGPDCITTVHISLLADYCLTVGSLL